MVFGIAKYLNSLFKEQEWGIYLKYGDTSLILIKINDFTAYCPIWNKIAEFFSMLQYRRIISPPGIIFCKTGRFLKVNKTTYRSDDTRKLKRKIRIPQNEEDYGRLESKGRQQSFVTVIQYEEGSSVILSFSGKYREHILLDFLMLHNNDLIQRLCSLASVYLTHATSPEVFKIAPGYIPFLPLEFQSMLKEANWFDENFSKKNITKDFLGGVLL
jgi:hypothetical protein